MGHGHARRPLTPLSELCELSGLGGASSIAGVDTAACIGILRMQLETWLKEGKPQSMQHEGQSPAGAGGGRKKGELEGRRAGARHLRGCEWGDGRWQSWSGVAERRIGE